MQIVSTNWVRDEELFLVNFPGLLHRFGDMVVFNDDIMDLVDVTDFEKWCNLFHYKDRSIIFPKSVL